MRAVWKGSPWPVLAATALLFGLVSCGGGSTPTTPPTTLPPTTPPTTLPSGRIILQGSEIVLARQLLLKDVTVESAGRLELNLTYTPTPKDGEIPVWLTDHQCNFQRFDADQCDYLVKSLAGPTPRTLVVPSIAPGTYTLFVHNDSTTQDVQMTYKVVLTP